jgi:hypothetical protein
MQKKFLLVLLILVSLFAVGQNCGNLPAPGDANPEIATQPQGPPARLPAPHYQADFTPVVANGAHSISWDKGHLVAFSVGEMKEPVAFYDRTGKSLFESFLPFDNAVRTYVQDAVATSSDKVIAAASVLSGDGASADIIAEIADGSIRRAIRTSPFYPLKICSTKNGTMWAYGKELDDSRAVEPRQDYPMLREYSFEKGQLRSALDRTTVRPPNGVPVGGTSHEVQMRCNAQKVVLINGATRELVQYDLSLSRVRRWAIAPLPEGVDFKHITGAALTDSGEIYVSMYDAPRRDSLTRILQLLPNASGVADWATVTAIPGEGNWFVLLGSDGDSLVYARGRRSPTLFWSKIQRRVTK